MSKWNSRREEKLWDAMRPQYSRQALSNLDAKAEMRKVWENRNFATIGRDNAHKKQEKPRKLLQISVGKV